MIQYFVVVESTLGLVRNKGQVPLAARERRQWSVVKVSGKELTVNSKPALLVAHFDKVDSITELQLMKTSY